jgi:hypothetical protein
MTDAHTVDICAGIQPPDRQHTWFDTQITDAVTLTSGLLMFTHRHSLLVLEAAVDISWDDRVI